MKNIIFLDIDGVLNCEKAFKDGFCKYVNWEDGKNGHHMSFYIPSKKWLNKLIKETDSDIVISSTWRLQGLEFLRKVWQLEKM